VPTTTSRYTHSFSKTAAAADCCQSESDSAFSQTRFLCLSHIVKNSKNHQCYLVFTRYIVLGIRIFLTVFFCKNSNTHHIIMLYNITTRNIRKFTIHLLPVIRPTFNLTTTTSRWARRSCHTRTQLPTSDFASDSSPTRISNVPSCSSSRIYTRGLHSGPKSTSIRSTHDSCPRFEYESLHKFVASLFHRVGVPENDADLASDSLLYGDLRGIDSHGLARLPNYMLGLVTGIINPTPNMKILRETPSTAAVDADNGLGLVIASKCNDIAIQKATAVGTGWVTCRNSTHYGVASYTLSNSTRHNLIGWSMSNTSKLMAPDHGRPRFFGTNPLAIGFPAKNEPPLVIDMATTAVSAGFIEQAMSAKETVPEGVLIDRYGRPTTDPSDLFTGGSLVPLGSTPGHSVHKGLALSVIVDVLSCVLSGSAWGPHAPSFPRFSHEGDFSVGKEAHVKKHIASPQPQQHGESTDRADSCRGAGIGHFFGAMQVEAFCDTDDFRTEMDSWLHEFRTLQRVDGADHTDMRVPGHIEYATEVDRRKNGIPVDDDDRAKLASLSKEFNVPLPPIKPPM
jgi:L-2-hydroxycarboxylate dehydrogenase (NAD+)